MLVLSRVVFCLLLLCANPVMARDVRLHGASSGGGECPEAVVADPRTPRALDNKRAAVATQSKAKVPTSVRGSSDDTGARTPRWHRFLPGMFR